MALDKEDKDYFVETGEYFGYPECCINSFVEMLDQEKSFCDLPEIQQKHNKDGFTPCVECSNKIEKGEIVIENLIDYEKRQHPMPFSS